ncbi:MAG: FGGY-family carbohydrate kinase [Alkalispirochaetaceae bacterium]
MKARYIVAVDQSTSATKACLFDERGAIVNRATVEHKQYYPQPGYVEHDAQEILENTHRAVSQVVAEAGIDTKTVAALAITNQRETVVAWDSESGKPVYHALVWQDERGTAACQELLKQGAGEEIKKRTGLVVDTYFSASKLQWMVENVPQCARAAEAGTLMAGTVDSWLIWNFTGRTLFATDYSNASRTLLFNIDEGRWDERLLEFFNLPSIRLPEVRYSDETFGRYRFPETGEEVPIIGVMGDSHAALYGHAGFDRGAAKTTFGTGSSVMMNIGPGFRRSPDGVVTSVAWGVNGEVSYVYEGNIHYTGDTIRWVRDSLGLFADYGEAESRASALNDNGGVYLVPAFSGLGAPHWVHGIRAAITGLSRGSGADHIIRAGFESIAFQVNDVIETMLTGEKLTLPSLHVDGGPTGNRFLMQFLADILAVPIHVGGVEEVSARGVAFVAGVAAGVWKDREALERIVEPSAVYEPRMEPTKRDALLQGWRNALEQVLVNAKKER